MNSKILIKLIKNNGWYLVATKGSHQQFKHKLKKGRVTIPNPKKNLPKGTVASILKQAQITI